MSSSIYIIKDVNITLTMPDDTTEVMTLEAPNDAHSPYWFRMIEEAPSGERIYKDPSRTRQKAFVDYYPEFHFNYAHHRMFTTLLLVAKNIELKHSPPFDTPMTTDCIFLNDSAKKNYMGGMAVASSDANNPNPVASGETELVFIGKKPLSWQQALNYIFYQ